MGAIKRTFVALVTVVVAAECFVPFLKRESDPRPPYHHRSDCEDEIASCVAPVQHNPLVTSGSSDPSILLSHVDELCGLYDEVVRCIRPSLDKCDQRIRGYLEQSYSVGDFLCSARGRSLLREVQHSACVSQPMLVYGLEAAIQYCVAESIQENGSAYPDFCQQIRLTRSCSIQTTTRECGEAAGEIFSEVYDNVVPQFPGTNCPEEGSHEYLKRGLELLRKRFIK